MNNLSFYDYDFREFHSMYCQIPAATDNHCYNTSCSNCKFRKIREANGNLNHRFNEKQKFITSRLLRF